ncbi:MAG: hypothetical protein JXR49_04965 [Acidobacteria bacterium]|nr:hypothetical protein [Acidobacteriota bacterium]
MTDVYIELKEKFHRISEEEKLLLEPVRVRARALTTEEAIGNPEADDFPLQKGKEKLMQAEFLGSAGQAFTDQYGDFEGILEDVIRMDLANNFRRAVFVSTLNAVSRHLKKTENTVHCRDKEPAECAAELASYIREKFGKVKVALVGFQPRMVEALSAQFPLRVLDLDKDNIGKEKFGVTIEGPERTDAVLDWANLPVVTGTTLVNGTIGSFLRDAPCLFYGTTIAGAAHLMGWERFCARSH